MSFDSLMLNAVVSELKEKILDGQILSVQQSSPNEFSLKILNYGETFNLLFSIHPVYARIHLIEMPLETNKRWHFSDFINTHIRKGKISLIEQVDFDRIIKIHIIPPKNIIDVAPKTLIGEFMGKHSNVILIDGNTNKILECMKHIDENTSRYRQVLPGELYQSPPSNQIYDFFKIDKDTFAKIICKDNKNIEKNLIKHIKGMSPSLANDIVAMSDDSPESLFKSFDYIRSIILNSKYSPSIITDKNSDIISVEAVDFALNDNLERKDFNSISKALEYYYQRLIAKEHFIAERNSLIQAVKKKITELEEKQDLIDEQMKTAEDAETLKIKGDILIANIRNIKRGQKEVSLPNIYDPDEPNITIKLDERLSPSDNAQRYFENYKKAKKSKDILMRLSDKNKSELNYIRNMVQRIESTEDIDGLLEIRSELTKRKLIKEKSTDTKKVKEESLPFRRFRSSENFLIYVGRNDKENDLLVRYESSPNDMWLHAKQIEGSHVVIKNPEKRPDIPRKTLLEAAVIAANFSKAKHSSVVPIDYTWVKYVRKPKGAKPGFVVYTNEKTLFVSPSSNN
ncbi:MAG: Rqc2 family fibronectin-binding protein [Candidatus Poribacteria bacterium]